ncbi:alpha/beta hydrolase [Sphingomonas gilva]|uniref:Alpha/beta hydrolase n=2 Tax=Sphingomonas gilva TaxID=2305907 RepID=A0A396RS01_9SPHN|nr:alpha/beta hydrolase [Sphingomonas gilva]
MEHISVISIGEGEPVVLIPGLSSPRAVWDGIAPELARTHRVLLVQVNGFAGDDPGANVKPGVLDGVIADLDKLIAREKLEKPAIIGHSMGGLVGMMLASRHPDRVGRLMVVDALPFIGTLFGAKDVAGIIARSEQMRDMMLAAKRMPTPVTTDPGGIWSNTPEGRIRIANWSAKTDARVSAQAMHEVMTTDIRPELAKIAARPFTVLYATGGGPQATAIWQREYAGSPATLVAVPDSYHFVMLDQPTRFAAEVEAFLAQ